MEHRRPRPLRTVLIAALIGLPVLYVASFGPACWLVDRDLAPVRPLAIAYYPILRYCVADSLPSPYFTYWLDRYAGIGALKMADEVEIEVRYGSFL